MKAAFVLILLLCGIAPESVAASNEPCYARLRLLCYKAAGEGQRTYSYSFTNRFSHPVYYLVHRRDVSEIAGEPFHYECYRRWGLWSQPQYQFRDVRLEFRRVRQGETITFRITRPRSVWPWRAAVAFYAKPDYAAVSEMVFSEPTRN